VNSRSPAFRYPAGDLGLDGDPLAGDAAADLVEVEGDVLRDGDARDDAGGGHGGRGPFGLVAARGQDQQGD
jgi:hypothetical protein